MMIYLLYKKQSCTELTNSEWNIQSQRLNPFCLFVPNEAKSFKLLLLRLYFSFITFFKAKVYYVTYNGVLVHTSYVIPKCFKFPFLNNNDFEIGPCHTHPEYRGKGIYPQVLKHILSNENKNSHFYMLVQESNTASIKGIEKAGFIKYGLCKKARFNIYRMV